MPWPGSPVFAYVSEALSTSVQARVPDCWLSSAPELVNGPGQTGASLTEVTVIETVAVVESSEPSLTLKVNESGPK